MALNRNRSLRLAGTLAVGVVGWFTPPPDGVDIQAWHLLAIFIATIVGITKLISQGIKKCILINVYE